MLLQGTVVLAGGMLSGKAVRNVSGNADTHGVFDLSKPLSVLTGESTLASGLFRLAAATPLSLSIDSTLRVVNSTLAFLTTTAGNLPLVGQLLSLSNSSIQAGPISISLPSGSSLDVDGDCEVTTTSAVKVAGVLSVKVGSLLSLSLSSAGVALDLAAGSNSAIGVGASLDVGLNGIKIAGKLATSGLVKAGLLETLTGSEVDIALGASLTATGLDVAAGAMVAIGGTAAVDTTTVPTGAALDVPGTIAGSLLSLGGSLQIGGAAAFGTANVVAKAALNVAGSLTSDIINLGGSLQIDGAATFGTANVVAKAALNVAGSLTSDILDLGGSLAVNGSASFGTASVAADATLDVAGSLISGALSLAGTINLGGSANVNVLDIGTTAKLSLGTAGSLVGSALSLAGELTLPLGASISIPNIELLGGSLLSGGNLTADTVNMTSSTSQLDLSGGSLINSLLAVAGAIKINANVELGIAQLNAGVDLSIKTGALLSGQALIAADAIINAEAGSEVKLATLSLSAKASAAIAGESFLSSINLATGASLNVAGIGASLYTDTLIATGADMEAGPGGLLKIGADLALSAAGLNVAAAAEVAVGGNALLGLAVDATVDGLLEVGAKLSVGDGSILALGVDAKVGTAELALDLGGRIDAAALVIGAGDMESGTIIARNGAVLLGGELHAHRVTVVSGAHVRLGGGIRLFVDEFISEGDVEVDGDVFITGRFENRGSLAAVTNKRSQETSTVSTGSFYSFGRMLVNIFPAVRTPTAPAPVAAAAPVAAPEESAPVDSPVDVPIAAPIDTPAESPVNAETAPSATPVDEAAPIDAPAVVITAESDLFVAAGDAQMSGILHITGVTALEDGDVATIITYSSSSGQFAAIESDSASCQVAPTANYGPTALNILFTTTCSGEDGVVSRSYLPY
jgi:hypothetical protein